MFYSNPFIWRFIPGQDRRSSECITRKMTKAEREKYGQANKEQYRGTAGIMFIKHKGPRKNMIATDAQLIQAAKEFGTDKEGLTKIAEKYGYASSSSIKARVHRLMNLDCK